MSGFNGMQHWEQYYRRHRVNIERILENTPSAMEMFGSVAEDSRRLRKATNGDLAEELREVGFEYPPAALLIDEVCSRLTGVEEIAAEAEPGVN